MSRVRLVVSSLLIGTVLLGVALGSAARAQDRDDDVARLLALHEAVLDAHRGGDVELLLADEADTTYVVASRGEVSMPARDDRRARLGPYLDATEFEVYRDLRPPVVEVSDDGTLGWVVVEVEARGVQRTDDDETVPVEFVCAWIELYRKIDGRWMRVGNVSNFRP